MIPPDELHKDSAKVLRAAMDIRQALKEHLENMRGPKTVGQNWQ
jgi:hypothetical protein